MFHIAVPALSERRDDIPLLVDHFVKQMSARHGKAVTRVSPAAREALMRHPWPGNVRELEHTIERAVLLTEGAEIETVFLPEPEDEDDPTEMGLSGRTLPRAPARRGARP